MERCHGTTKAGERCKRSAPDGELYCGMHAGQAADEPDAGEAVESEDERGLFDTIIVVAAAGIALAAALAFRRVFRFG